MTSLGPYRLEEELGRGGMGAVFRAVDTRGGAQVALKVLLDLEPELLERFKREAEAQREVEHPNLVRVHDVSLAPPRPYVALELIAGETLEQRVKREGPLPWPTAAHVLAEVADGLAAAHAHGLLHRDVKPANVLLGPGGAQLADFGLVKPLGAQTLTQTGAILGTPGYLAPEQIGAESGAWSPATDVYGAAATLFYALVGRAPFAGRSVVEVLTQVAHAPPPSPRALQPDVPAWLDALCVRGLSKDPAQRHPTAAAFRGALLDGGPAPARGRGWRWAPVLASGLTLGAAGVWASSEGGGAPPAPAEARPAPAEARPAPAEARPAPAADEAAPGAWILDVLERPAELGIRVGGLSLPELRELEAVLGRAIAREPERVELYRALAAVHVAARRFAAAEEDAERILELAPGDLYGLLARGLARRGQGRVVEALAALRQAWAAHPEHGSLAAQVEVLERTAPESEEARRLADAGRVSEAMERLTRALARPGVDRELLRKQRGELALIGGRWAEAEGDARWLVEAAPHDAGYRLSLLRALSARGRFDQAQEQLAALQELAVDGPEARALEVELRVSQGLYQRALADADALVAAHPDFGGGHLARGLVLAVLKRREEAVEALDVAERLGAANVRLLYSRGQLLAELGRLAQAEREFDRLVELAPDFRPARIRRAQLRLAEATELALEDAQRAYALEPDGKSACLVASALNRLERYAEAEPFAREAVRSGLLRSEGVLGITLIRLGRLREARDVLTAGLTREPDAELFLARAEAGLGLGQLQDALADVDRALGLAPRGARAHLARAEVLYRLGDSARALAAFERASALGGALPPRFQLIRGWAYEALRRWEEARADFQAVLARDPSRSRARLGLARVALMQGQPAEALAALDRVPAERRTGESEALRGLALAQAERVEASVAAYDRAVELEPEDLEIRLNRATARVAAGQLAAALEDCALLVARGADSARVREVEGRALELQGHPADAERAFGQALDLDPERVDVHALRARVRRSRGDRAGALEDARTALAHPERVVSVNLAELRALVAELEGAE